MSQSNPLITDHIDIWTSVILSKCTLGRGSNNKYELYRITKLRELTLELGVHGKLVPPERKQHRIVAKVDELMQICDQLKDKLQQSKTTKVELTDALVGQALA